MTKRAPKPKPAPRKRGRRNPIGTTDIRVREIMRIMARFGWDDAAAEELAAKWDMLPRSVHQLAGEASRRIHSLVSDDQEILGILKFSLMTLVRSCQEGRRQDRRTAVEACRVLAGIVASKKPKDGPGGDGAPTFVLQLSTPIGEGPAVAVPVSPPPSAPLAADAALEIPAEPQAS